VHLFTRRGFDWTERYPRISKAVAALQPASVTIDGEAVVCDEAGVAVFERLHSRAFDGEAFLYAFDLLELDGEDWRPRPLEERKAMLKKLLAKAPAGIRYSEHLEGDSAAIFAHACKLGAKGIVSKHREHRRQIAIQIQNCLYNWWVSKSERGRFRHVGENSGLLTLEHVHKHRRSFAAEIHLPMVFPMPISGKIVGL
jgi:hypothetical protein